MACRIPVPLKAVRRYPSSIESTMDYGLWTMDYGLWTIKMKANTITTGKATALKLPIMEAFYTIQGEGYFTGTPAYFIRTGGCDVGCLWCDVKDSWDAKKWPKQSVAELVATAKAHPSRTAVITGGEPMMHDMEMLTLSLRKEGFKTNVETSGTRPLSGYWDWICFSPKKFKKPLDEYYEKAHELKVVVYHPSDLRWAESHAGKMNPDAQLYLQPEWEKSDKMLPEILNYVKARPYWKISLQTHKFMKIP